MGKNLIRFLIIAVFCLAIIFMSHSIQTTEEKDDPEKLTVLGMLRTGSQRVFDFSSLLAFPSREYVATDPFFLDRSGAAKKFQGFLLKDLVDESRPVTQNPKIVLVGADGFHAVVRDEDFQSCVILVAYLENGSPIGMERGPFRVIVDPGSADNEKRKQLMGICVWNLRKVLIGEQPPANRSALKLWTSLPSYITEQIEGEFENRHPEIDLVVENHGASEMHDQVASWIASQTALPADVILFSEPSDAERLKISGRLHRFFPKYAETIPPFYRDPDGYYFGLRVVNIGLALNTNYPPPASLTDLLLPVYAGKTGWVSSKQIGIYLLSSIINQDDLGWDFIRNLLISIPKENLFSSFGDCSDSVASGKLAAGFTLDYLVSNMLRANPDLSLTFTQPRDCQVSVFSPVVISSGTGKLAEAEMLVNDLFSDDMQRSLIKNGFTPTRADLRANAAAVASEPLPLASAQGSVSGGPLPLASAQGSVSGGPLPLESAQGSVSGGPLPLDHRYISANRDNLRKIYDELEELVYEEK